MNLLREDIASDFIIICLDSYCGYDETCENLDGGYQCLCQDGYYRQDFRSVKLWEKILVQLSTFDIILILIKESYYLKRC